MDKNSKTKHFYKVDVFKGDWEQDHIVTSYKSNPKGDENLNFDFLNNLDRDSYYNVRIYVDIYKKENQKKSGHNCIFSDSELYDVLYKFSNEDIPFSRDVISRYVNKKVIRLSFHGDNIGIKVRFLLTIMKYLYEFPYNVFLKDVLKLQNADNICEQEHILNLLQVVETLNKPNISFTSLFGGTNKRLINPDIVREHLNNRKCSSIKTIYHISLSKEISSRYLINADKANLTYEYWILEDNSINYRIEQYKKYHDALISNDDFLGVSVKFNCANTVNFYSATFTRNKELIDCKKAGYVCWGKLIHKLSEGVKYAKVSLDILIYKSRYGYPYKGKHGCLLDKDSLESYLKEISNTYIPFEYTLEESGEKYKLKVIFRRHNKREILWDLNLIRHAYEFPFNAFLHEATALRGLEEFKDEHLTNILQVIATSARYQACYSIDQSLGYIGCKLIPVDEVKSKLQTVTRVSDVYKDTIISFTSYYPKGAVANDKKFIGLPGCRTSKKYGKINIDSYAYWFDHSDEEFEKQRVNTYLNNYKILKGKGE